MTKELALQTENELAIKEELEKEVLQFVFGGENAKKFTDGQKKLCIKVAQALRLSVVKKEIYFMPYFSKNEKKWNISTVIGYENYIKRGQRSGLLTGWKAWTEGETNKGNLKAYIQIYRKDWKIPFEHEVEYLEYVQKNQYGINKMWKEKPKTMLKKVVISQGFKLAFPEEMSELGKTLSFEEFNSFDNINETVPEKNTGQRKEKAEIGKPLETIKTKSVDTEISVGIIEGEFEEVEKDEIVGDLQATIENDLLTELNKIQCFYKNIGADKEFLQAISPYKSIKEIPLDKLGIISDHLFDQIILIQKSKIKKAENVFNEKNKSKIFKTVVSNFEKENNFNSEKTIDYEKLNNLILCLFKEFENC